MSLLESRTFANEQESEELINLYKKESNTVLAYLDLDYSDNFCFLLSHSNKNIVKKQDIYTSYICFCKKHHYLPLGRNMFYMELRNTNLFDEIIISGTRYFKFLGFKV